MRLKNFAQGQWVAGVGGAVDLLNAATGDKVAETTSAGLDFRPCLITGGWWEARTCAASPSTNGLTSSGPRSIPHGAKNRALPDLRVDRRHQG